MRCGRWPGGARRRSGPSRWRSGFGSRCGPPGKGGREELRALAEGVAGDGGAPEELRALARVLLQILDGNFQPDLSGLPEEWAGWVRAAVGAG